MRRLLVAILKWRRRVLRGNVERLAELIEDYGGIAHPGTIIDWRARMRAQQKRLEDVDARLHRAGA